MQGVYWLRTHPPNKQNVNLKNTDTAHNARCVEEKSIFFKKRPPHFPLFYITPPISFLAYGPVVFS